MYHFQRKHTQCEKDNLNIHVVSKRNQYSGIGHLPLFSWWSRKKNKACEQTLRVREMPLRGPTHTDTQTHTQLHCKTRLHFRQNAQVVRFTVAPGAFLSKSAAPTWTPPEPLVPQGLGDWVVGAGRHAACGRGRSPGPGTRPTRCWP